MNYHRIESTNLSNGIGWRVVLWVSGCEHHCEGCHNPETWDYNSGKPFGKRELHKILDFMSKPYVKGLTISGGDPLAPQNRDEILSILKVVKEEFPDKDIWLYTGYNYEDVCDLDILKYVNVLVDGKFILSQRDITLPFRGSLNQRIIKLKNGEYDGNYDFS